MVVVKIKCGLVEGELSTVSEKNSVSGCFRKLSRSFEICQGILKIVREF